MVQSWYKILYRIVKNLGQSIPMIPIFFGRCSNSITSGYNMIFDISIGWPQWLWFLCADIVFSWIDAFFHGTVDGIMRAKKKVRKKNAIENCGDLGGAGNWSSSPISSHAASEHFMFIPSSGLFNSTTWTTVNKFSATTISIALSVLISIDISWYYNIQAHIQVSSMDIPLTSSLSHNSYEGRINFCYW